MSEKTCGNCWWLARWVNYPERNHGLCIKADREALSKYREARDDAT